MHGRFGGIGDGVTLRESKPECGGSRCLDGVCGDGIHREAGVAGGANRAVRCILEDCSRIVDGVGVAAWASAGIEWTAATVGLKAVAAAAASAG